MHRIKEGEKKCKRGCKTEEQTIDREGRWIQIQRETETKNHSQRNRFLSPDSLAEKETMNCSAWGCIERTGVRIKRRKRKVTEGFGATPEAVEKLV